MPKGKSLDGEKARGGEAKEWRRDGRRLFLEVVWRRKIRG
jgi:hypothetical protein